MPNHNEDILEAMVGPPGVWQECRDFQIEFLRRMGLQEHHTILDIGCGPLRGGVPLIEFLDPGNYTGIDVRAEMIEVAREQVIKAELESKRPSLLVSGNFGKVALQNRQFDYIWPFQVLYHLHDSQLDELFQQLCELMGPGSVCYANVNILAPSANWKEFPFHQRSLEFYHGFAQRHSLEMKNLGQLKDYNYTTKVGGQFNFMLKFTRVRVQGVRALETPPGIGSGGNKF